MPRFHHCVRLATHSSLVSASLAVLLAVLVAGGGKAPLKSTTTKLDPRAPQIGMFDGMASGQFEVRMTAADVNHGHLFVKNTTTQPLTVEIPKSFVGVHVLKQFPTVGQQGLGIGFGNSFSSGNQGLGAGNQQGQLGGGQSQGAGIGNQQGQGISGSQNLGVGQNFFTIPPDRVVQIPYQGLCLNYGRKDPNPLFRYLPVPTEQFTEDPTLQAILDDFGTGKVTTEVAQAAAWNLNSGLSWEQLASQRKSRTFGLPPLDPVFSGNQLRDAQRLIQETTAQARKTEKPAAPVKPTEVARAKAR